MRAWGGIAGLQYALPASWTPWHKAGLGLARFTEASGRAATPLLGSSAALGWWCRAAARRLHNTSPPHAAHCPAQAWSAKPARMAGLGKRKGQLASGFDADIVVWSPEAAADTSPAALQHKHKVTPYAGEPLLGRVLATFVRGQQVFADGKGGVAGEACGRSTLYAAPPKRR